MMDVNRMRRVLRMIRSERGDAQIDVAYHAKRAPSSISRFERGETDTLYMRQGVMRYLRHSNYHRYVFTTNGARNPDINRAWKDRNYEQLQELFDESDWNDPASWLGFDLQRQEHLFNWGVNKYGGRFISKLKDTYRKGDLENSRKIRRTWAHWWLRYVVFGRIAEVEAEEQAQA